jgi:hypothetical protein
METTPKGGQQTMDKYFKPSEKRGDIVRSNSNDQSPKVSRSPFVCDKINRFHLIRDQKQMMKKPINSQIRKLLFNL